MAAPASFTLQAAPGTDIWKKPPSTNVWNAPITRTTSGPLRKFRSARATFWADWTEQYDQAGLLLVPRHKSSSSSSSSSSSPSPPAQWVKTGIEYYQDAPQLSTVGCDRFADWSVGPLTTEKTTGTTDDVTLEVVREADEHGRSLWVYRVVLDAGGNEVRRIPLREICWILADEEEGGGDEWVLEVSPLVARPSKSAEGDLVVTFFDFRVEWLE